MTPNKLLSIGRRNRPFGHPFGRPFGIHATFISMPKKRSNIVAAFAVLAMVCALTGNAPAVESLPQSFAQPPAAARPWVYWYFMDGNLTREGMTADLEAMKRAGIGGATFLEVNIGIPRGPVDFMSPQWQDLFAHAMSEADRLGIQIALGAGPGWCGTGGPWIQPELAMQHLVASETNVTGPLKFSAKLPQPKPRTPYFGEGTLTPRLKKEWQEFYRDVAVLAFPVPDGTNRIAEVDEKALYYREPFSSKAGVKPFLPAPAHFPVLPATDCITTSRMTELTTKMSPDGHLVWDVPPGRWTIMRLGRTLTGQTTRPAPDPGLGFESDKFDRAALDAHYSDFIQKLLSRVAPRTNSNGGLSMLHFDSWEMSSQNWSSRYREEFKKRRGYDPLKFLPVYAGRVVGSPEISERFLWDLRQTAQELVVENHVGYLKTLAHKSGLSFSAEPYDLNPCADLTLGRVADVPQCEFWYRGFDTTYSVIEAASIAHTCGRGIVVAEAFTSEPGEDWTADPAALKSLGDWAFCAGVNRFDFHRFQAQPWNDRKPGMTMASYGVHWDRTQTWWDMVPAYHEYLARCQALLQRGVTVADVCFLAAEGAPHVFRPPASAVTGTPPDHSGYNFDGCAPETLLERASVKNGNIIFPGGTTYRILVLPARETMTPKLLTKVKSLVRDGATICGPAPIKSPSLQNFQKCDAVVKNLAREIWGDCDGKTVFSHALGKGRVVWLNKEIKPMEQYGDYAAVTSLLKELGVPPDFEANGPIRFTHRRDGEAEVYFVANRDPQPVEANCAFRVAGRQPELWDPMTGATRALPQFTERDGRTTVPMRFEPTQSFFVVFRASVKTNETAALNFLTTKPAFRLSGSWEVSFDPKWGGSEKVIFDSLNDWSQRTEPGIKYYSGKATYQKTFELTARLPVPGQKYYLDLGVVKNLARVRLNGRDLGVVWCAPWRVEVSDALTAGTNHLEIEVANLWPNRLIGDQSLPENQRLAWTTINPYRKDSTLLPSGLLGPVTILTASNSELMSPNN
jgi:hypothetical protein